MQRRKMGGEGKRGEARKEKGKSDIHTKLKI